MNTNNSSRPLYDIANEIQKSWPQYRDSSAVSYVNAMSRLDTINDSYGTSTGKKVVEYFIRYSQDYKGEHADKIKEELLEMIADKE